MTIDDLLRYAPDARALEGARRLFFSRRWRLLAGDGRWIWGEFQVGDNEALYAAVNLLQAEFHCTCRSRNRPCTHALALLMKLKSRPDEWTVSEPPTWVRKLMTRSPVGVKPAEKSPKSTSVDALTFGPSPERRQLMDQGVAELETRLLDLLRSGLAEAVELEPDYWLAAAARLTDAQLPGPAGRLRRLAGHEILKPAKILRVLGDLYLLCRAWRQVDDLTPSRQAELFQLMGMSPKKDLVSTQAPKEDLWLVIGVNEGVEDRLRYRRVWLRGEQRRRYALIIDYAFGERPFERSWPLASAWQGVLHYYPGNYPRRAIFPHPRPADRAYRGLRGYASYAELLHDYSRALALNPWLPDYPAYLAAVRPVSIDGQAHLLDADDRAYPLAADFSGFYTLLAVGGVDTISIFATFNGYTIKPLSLYLAEGLVAV